MLSREDCKDWLVYRYISMSLYSYLSFKSFTETLQSALCHPASYAEVIASVVTAALRQHGR